MARFGLWTIICWPLVCSIKWLELCCLWPFGVQIFPGKCHCRVHILFFHHYHEPEERNKLTYLIIPFRAPYCQHWTKVKLTCDPLIASARLYQPVSFAKNKEEIALRGVSFGDEMAFTEIDSVSEAPAFSPCLCPQQTQRLLTIASSFRRDTFSLPHLRDCPGNIRRRPQKRAVKVFCTRLHRHRSSSPRRLRWWEGCSSA